MTDAKPPLPDGSQLAALDLGSNSFHLIIARLEHGELRPVQTLAEKVQLGAGLENHRLSDAAIQRGLACLARFSQVLQSVEPERLRIVGTNALRQARNRDAFIVPARELLGSEVEIIYGREEARLVYLGVAHTLADDSRARLVVDIGGGSTEFIIGRRFEPQRLESLQLGCVSYSHRYFPDQKLTRNAFGEASAAARLEVSHIRRHFHSGHWEEAVGSSGTLNAIAAVLQRQGWTDGTIDARALARLRDALLEFRHFDAIELDGLSESRRNVIAAGVAVAEALFAELGVARMATSRGALREGVIYDLIGRLTHEDVRERTINALMQRYGVDEALALRTASAAEGLFTGAREGWALGRRDRELLAWAARAHEIGMAISHKHHHRHGAYLLRNSDLPGFAQAEQEALAALVQSHRGKLKHGLPEPVPLAPPQRMARLVALLRLATVFKYTLDPDPLPELHVSTDGDRLRLGFPDGWLDAHSLTREELAREERILQRIDIRLKLS